MIKYSEMSHDEFKKVLIEYTLHSEVSLVSNTLLYEIIKKLEDSYKKGYSAGCAAGEHIGYDMGYETGYNQGYKAKCEANCENKETINV